MRWGREGGADGPGSRVDQSEGTYGNLEHKLLAVVLGLNGVENGRELVTLELHCNMANSRSAIVREDDIRPIAMGWTMDWGRGKDFRDSVCSPNPGQGVSREPRTVNDGTNNLVNLARLSDIRAGEASREGGQGIGAQAGDGGWPGEGSPPEGPGETAVEREKPVRGSPSKRKKNNGC